jgi:DNA-binding transcriptional regulator YhcF (GntR family)
MIRPPDPASHVPLFGQIADQLRWQISTGALRPGTPLPATRDAATAWRVHRHTVAKAYRQLRDGGLVIAGGNGRLQVAAGPAAQPDAPGVESFLAETIEMARAQLGLSPGALITALRGHAGDEFEPDRVCAIECTPDQCTDLARQLEAHWRIGAETFCLADAGEPPEGPLVATLFHFEELRERWPHRLAEIRFVTAAVDPVVRDMVEHVARGPRHHDVVLLVRHDATAGLTLAEELETLLGPRYPLRLEVQNRRRDPGSRPDAEVVIATPSAYAALEEAARARLDVIRLRYAIDPRDLGTLGVVFGWSMRVPRVSQVHAQ